MMANEGSYPENARALAMNGAEVVYRASIPHPAASNDYFEIQNRARALDNNMYVVAPNMGTYYLSGTSEAPIDTFGGNSMIVDYRGQIVGAQRYGGVSTSVCGPVNIEALRHHRATSPWTNWMKDLRTEMYQIVYEAPIYPKNLYLERPPFTPRRVQGGGHRPPDRADARARHLGAALQVARHGRPKGMWPAPPGASPRMVAATGANRRLSPVL